MRHIQPTELARNMHVYYNEHGEPIGYDYDETPEEAREWAELEEYEGYDDEEEEEE